MKNLHEKIEQKKDIREYAVENIYALLICICLTFR